MIDLDEEYMVGLYNDDLIKMIIRYLSDNDLSYDEKVERLVEYMEDRGIE